MPRRYVCSCSQVIGLALCALIAAACTSAKSDADRYCQAAGDEAALAGFEAKNGDFRKVLLALRHTGASQRYELLEVAMRRDLDAKDWSCPALRELWAAEERRRCAKIAVHGCKPTKERCKMLEDATVGALPTWIGKGFGQALAAELPRVPALKADAKAIIAALSKRVEGPLPQEIQQLVGAGVVQLLKLAGCGESKPQPTFATDKRCKPIEEAIVQLAGKVVLFPKTATIEVLKERGQQDAWTALAPAMGRRIGELLGKATRGEDDPLEQLLYLTNCKR